MRITLYYFLVFWTLGKSSAQTVFAGHIHDVGNQGDVSGVTITLLGNQQQTSSNSSGHFAIKTGDTESPKLQFFHHAMVWNGDKPLNIKVVGLDGRVLDVDVVSQGDTYLFPRMRKGIYLMVIETDVKSYSYKIMSDGQTTVNVDTRRVEYKNHDSSLLDTLYVEKEGYYSRRIPVTSGNASLRIGMLRGDYESLDYFNELIAPEAYDIISDSPARSNLGDVKQVKIIYDTKSGLLYYMNSKKYSLHLRFAEDVLGFDKGHFYFNQTQYTDNPNRYLYMASLNYYQGINKYVLQYVSAIEMDCDQIEFLYDKILETSFLKEDQLSFFPIKEEWELCSALNLITSDELYQGQTYQGLNPESNYGYLNKVSAEAIESEFVTRRDIILTNGIPNDLPVVAGIITSEFQTPLSHINVLSHSRNTPNMALRGAWEDPDLDKLNGKLVYLEVKSTGYELREATLNEAQAFWKTKEPQQSVVLQKNLSYSSIVDMQDADHTYVNRIGGKAANFGELLNVRTIDIPTPENAFGIPFYYYHQHMEQYGLNTWVEDLIHDPMFLSNAAYRKSQLEKLRDSIVSSPINAELVALVTTKIDNFSEFESYRFRSSTNAEDLETFSGAGLYDSYSAKKNHSTKTIDAAIKKVWASLWNWRAFEERDYFKIDHLSCAMGVLVHRAFPDEDANGVVVTKNLYNTNPGYIINVQYGEESIVFPEPGIIHDQMILFTWSIDPKEDFMLEYLSFSNVSELNGKRVMTDAEVFELGRYVTEIKKRFFLSLPHNCQCDYNDFGVDIEFKVDSEVSPRKIYVKQARLYR